MRNGWTETRAYRTQIVATKINGVVFTSRAQSVVSSCQRGFAKESTSETSYEGMECECVSTQTFITPLTQSKRNIYHA